MEEGSLRCDANVSIRPVGSTELGTKTELKNMNSFRFVMQGINAEIARQTALLEAGEEVAQETLHFDPVSGRISSLRSKEEAHDYRYFPEPDLVPIVPTPEMLETARARAPRAARRARGPLRERVRAARGHRAAVRVRARWGQFFERAAAESRDPGAATGSRAAHARRRPGRRPPSQAKLVDAGGRQEGHVRQRPACST